jgi:SagB-type dehydrogenase family enzyme
VATLKGLTFGVQRWLDIGDDRWVALKSSPSGGARHSIEAYLISFGVEGLANGTYHYDPDSHALTLLESSTSIERMTAFIPRQPWFQDPAVFVVMTSVFGRMQYKYATPYAYRVVLLDAGHLSQTFLLVATALGLAPYCVAALDGPAIEQHLGIDGISEAAVHAVGVGSRPEGKEWAPIRAAENPRTTRPTWAERLPALSRP